MHVYILIAIWCAGIATAAIAIFIPVYANFVIVGAVGWVTVAASSGLILYEIKRIRAEDRKKEMA
jgi:4-hydroxybenzoate polyprenyltransferase